MEKITFKHMVGGAYVCQCGEVFCPINHSGDYYRASDVDAYRAAVAGLVEAVEKYVEITVKVLDGKADKLEAMTVASTLQQAIASVEADGKEG